MNVKAAVIAERMYNEKANTDGERGANPNAEVVAIDEPVEQQAPLDHGMPPAPTGMTVGDKWKGRAGTSEEQGRGPRYSYEQLEVVVEGPSGDHVVPSYGSDVYEA